MNKAFIIALLLSFTTAAKGQKVIQLYNGAAPGSENWTYREKEIKTKGMEIAYNVSHPTLTVYAPNPAIATGTGIIVCPGGGFYILVTGSEGNEVVNYLVKKGITVFLLKYRLGQSMTDTPAQELTANMKKAGFVSKIMHIIPLSVADGKEAIKY